MSGMNGRFGFGNFGQKPAGRCVGGQPQPGARLAGYWPIVRPQKQIVAPAMKT